MFIESRINQNPECNDDTFCSSESPSDISTLFGTQCSLGTMNHSSSSGIHNSTSSFASISSSVSNSQEEHAFSISPVNSLVPEASVNGLTPSAISGAPSNCCETTLQEPSSYIYPPSPTTSLGRVSSNSYATDPSSIPIPDTLLNDRHSLHTPVRSIASGEKLVLTTVDNGAEPLGIDMSPSSSPKQQSSKNLSPRLPRSRHNSSSPTAFRQFDLVEETIACELPSCMLFTTSCLLNLLPDYQITSTNWVVL